MTMDQPASTPSEQPLPLAWVEGRLAVVRLDPSGEIPEWVNSQLIKSGPLVSVSRTASETSIILAEAALPENPGSLVRLERGWRAFGVAAQLDMNMIGVMAALVQPLASAGISVLTVSTFDTDYLLVREELVHDTMRALSGVGEFRNQP